MMMDRTGLQGLGMCLDWRTNNSCVQSACAQGPTSGVTTDPPSDAADYSWLIWLVVAFGALVILGGDDK